MNRHDWMKVLTKGYRPPKQKKEKKTTANNLKAVLNNTEESATRPVDENEISTADDIISTDNFQIDLLEDADSKLKDGVKKSKEKSVEKLAQIKQQEVNHFRNLKNINVSGTDIPHPVETFEQLTTEYKLSQKLMANLHREKYSGPTPIQMQAWPLLMRRREVLACAPTGSGKTAAFLLPIIHHLKSPRVKGFRAVILAPTRELAKQLVRESDRLTQGTGLKSNVISKVKGAFGANFFKKFDILVTTPNRLIYLLEQDENVRKMLQRVEWLIVDESDKLFEAGRTGFRDQLATLFRACSGPGVLRAMFSATVSFDVEEWAKLNLNDVVTVAIGTRNTCPDVEQSLSFCASNAGKIMEIHNILRKGYDIPCLIFVQTKERAQKLCDEILLTNRPVRCIHADISQAKRDEIVRSFREKKIWILICTELMGRGIDFKGVNLVINYDFPPSIVSYVHRVGRTGRAGQKGKAITFWSLEDKPMLRSIGLVMQNSGSEVPDWILSLKGTSTKQRKRYAKNMPDRGGIHDGVKGVKKKGGGGGGERKMNKGADKKNQGTKRKAEESLDDNDGGDKENNNNNNNNNKKIKKTPDGNTKENKKLKKKTKTNLTKEEDDKSSQLRRANKKRKGRRTEKYEKKK